MVIFFIPVPTSVNMVDASKVVAECLRTFDERKSFHTSKKRSKKLRRPGLLRIDANFLVNYLHR